MRGLQIVLTSFLLVALVAVSDAANLTIRTFEQNPNGASAIGPLAGATVCYDTADGIHAGRATTDSTGFATFNNVPEGTLTVRAFKSGFIGKALTFFMTGDNTFQQISLLQGAGAELVCPTISAGQVPSGEIQITAFKINDGAESTTSRPVTLNFTTGPRNAGEPNPVPEFFRAVEGGSVAELFQEPYVPLTSTTSAPFTLALRRSQDGHRYGGRLILFQVKAGSNLSQFLMDVIRLDPVLRDYETSYRAAVAFARSHGYSAAEAREASDGVPTGVNPTEGVQVQVCNQCGSGDELHAPDRSCTYTTQAIFFTARELHQFWRLKQVVPDRGTALPIAPNVFRWIFSHTNPADPSIPKGLVCTHPRGLPFGGDCAETPGVCRVAAVRPDAILTFEGPTEDEVLFVDPSNPWKNAFARPVIRLPPFRPR